MEWISCQVTFGTSRAADCTAVKLVSYYVAAASSEKQQRWCLATFQRTVLDHVYLLQS
jgi:hypothetical protein